MKVAIIGVGGMAKYHLKGFRKAGADVVAVADMNAKRAESYAKENEIAHFYSSLTEVLEKERDLDAVSIVTPNKFHYSLVLEALKGGMNVFCEKPPALNAKEMKEMKDLSEKKEKILMFDFNNRARPDSVALKAYIDSGEVGKINSAEAGWIRRRGIPGIGGWFTNKEVSGGGPVIDLIHMLDLSLYFMGYPEPEYVLSSTFDTFMGNPDYKGPWGIPDNKNGICNVESSSHAFIRFSTGECLYTRSSWAEMVEREKVYVSLQGTKAGADLTRVFDEDGIDETAHDSLKLYTCENHNMVNRTILSEKDDEMGRTRMASSFIKTLEGKEKPLNTPDEALKLMKIVDALYSSSLTGKPVKIQTSRKGDEKE